MFASSRGLPPLLNQAFAPMLSILSVNVGKKANWNSPLVWTGPLKFVLLVNQTPPPLGLVWVSVNKAYIAKL